MLERLLYQPKDAAVGATLGVTAAQEDVLLSVTQRLVGLGRMPSRHHIHVPHAGPVSHRLLVKPPSEKVSGAGAKPLHDPCVLLLVGKSLVPSPCLTPRSLFHGLDAVRVSPRHPVEPPLAPIRGLLVEPLQNKPVLLLLLEKPVHPLRLVLRNPFHPGDAVHVLQSSLVHPPQLAVSRPFVGPRQDEFILFRIGERLVLVMALRSRLVVYPRHPLRVLHCLLVNEPPLMVRRALIKAGKRQLVLLTVKELGVGIGRGRQLLARRGFVHHFHLIIVD